MKTIKIAHLYYDLMNLYGENGNIRFLKKKLEDQNINVEIHFLGLDDKKDFTKYDVCYLGTGSHENLELVNKDLMKYKKDITDYIKNNKFFIVTGNAIELFGKHIEDLDGNKTKTLGCFDYTVLEEEFRTVGEQYYKCDLIKHSIIGFQNRNSVLNNVDSVIKLFDVVSGNGYSPLDNVEGIHKNNFYGTYLLGPLLVRNPYFTDYLVNSICTTNNIKYTKPVGDDVSYKAYLEYLINFYKDIEK